MRVSIRRMTRRFGPGRSGRVFRAGRGGSRLEIDPVRKRLFCAHPERAVARPLGYLVPEAHRVRNQEDGNGHQHQNGSQKHGNQCGNGGSRHQTGAFRLGFFFLGRLLSSGNPDTELPHGFIQETASAADRLDRTELKKTVLEKLFQRQEKISQNQTENQGFEKGRGQDENQDDDQRDRDPGPGPRNGIFPGMLFRRSRPSRNLFPAR
ncbi:MAG: hypothetical protein BWY31_04767 [Lentisphaerae bacterium ADurb.Bin242]|nr:MAG: hypothetical protein BWY31_04767 [Lentisphaerae bacterium ADurb.Bin242]